MSWNWLWASSHCMRLSCSFCNVFVRFAIARICLSRNVVWSSGGWWGYGLCDLGDTYGVCCRFGDYIVRG